MIVKNELLKFYHRPTNSWLYQYELLKYWEILKDDKDYGESYEEAVTEIKQWRRNAGTIR